jgi:HEAT repeat protein
MSKPGLETASPHSSLHSLIQALQEGNFQTRWEASKHLIRFGPEIIAPLSDLLAALEPFPASSRDSELDWFIAHILAELGHPTTLAPLSQLLNHPETDVKLQAASALARLGPVAIPTLEAQLAQTDTRLIAVQILGQIDDEPALALLITVAQDLDPAVRASALEALGHFINTRRIPEVIPVCLAALKGPVAAVRCAAINTLGRGATVAVPATDWQPQLDVWVEQLHPSLWDLDLSVCQQTALTLGRVGTTAATQALQERLREPASPALASKIVQALSGIATPTALAVLEHALNTSAEVKIQQDIVAHLGRLPASLHPQATDILLDFLDVFLNADATSALPPTPLLQAIVHSLGRLGQTKTIDNLIALLANPHSGVKFHVIAALKQLNPDLSYQHLQAKAQAQHLPTPLLQGILLALQEW